MSETTKYRNPFVIPAKSSKAGKMKNKKDKRKNNENKKRKYIENENY